MQDAYLLGLLLSDARVTLSQVAEVFKIYQDIRLPFSQTVVKNAVKVGRMYEFREPGLYDGMPVSAQSEEDELETTKARLHELSEAVRDLWKWQWLDRVEEHWEEAQRRLDALVHSDDGTTQQRKKKRLSKACSVM